MWRYYRGIHNRRGVADQGPPGEELQKRGYEGWSSRDEPCDTGVTARDLQRMLYRVEVLEVELDGRR